MKKYTKYSLHCYPTHTRFIATLPTLASVLPYPPSLTTHQTSFCPTLYTVSSMCVCVCVVLCCVHVSVVATVIHAHTGPQKKNSARYSARLTVRTYIDLSGCGAIENGVIRCCVVQTADIFTGNVRCENNDRLGSMHTSDHRRLVWYKKSGFTPSSEA